MNIKIEPTVFAELKDAMTKEGKTAARFYASGCGCKGPVFDISFDHVKEDDVVEEFEGTKFVYEKDFAAALKAPEIIKTENGFAVKRSACGC
ncbi:MULTISPECIES: hypothetical protein [unclassified Dehalobacter]|jgi:hypothetical protein|uniref:hypothetical protein n=1 Tax=unclassified Dehalobacter TaxID=2635733 RepID=UPI00028ABD79|nr:MULTISPECIES: hypothetical protein [unclassified Dehalobacter]AFV01186.1 hypothetical protein DHBDCA_p158 [Dehalobacter sp. DCA]AFV04228.1 hypothetical protein DCF50_p222 [Dehalobacter sp. CF]